MEKRPNCRTGGGQDQGDLGASCSRNPGLDINNVLSKEHGIWSEEAPTRQIWDNLCINNK